MDILLVLNCARINVQMNENFTSPWYADYKLSPDG
jgi:hypothetical protein